MKTELVRYYQWLRQYGYNDSHSGNISARDGESFWVTPTGACADTLIPDDLIRCPIRGRLSPGASGDANLHQAVYQHNPDAQAMIHSHCPHAVALTLSGEDFVPADFEGQLYFPEVRVISVAYDVYFEQAARRVAEALADALTEASAAPLCIVRGHGVYAWGRTLNEAYKWTCSLELSARTALLARQAGTIE